MRNKSSFIKVQIRKISIDKWCEGCRINSDPGQAYILEWISKNAQRFRENWEQSCCKECYNWQLCGHEVRTFCDSFKEPD